MKYRKMNLAKMNKLALVSVIVVLLVGCMKSSEENYNNNLAAMQRSLHESAENSKRVKSAAKDLMLPASVTTKIMPSALALPGTKDTSATARFDVSVNNVSAQEFFAGLSQGSNNSVILSPDVTGNISLDLKQVTLPEVLEAVSNLYGYHYEKTSYGYTIYPNQLETRIFMVDKLTLQRTLKTSTQLNSSSGDLTQAASSSSSGDGGGGGGYSPSTVAIQASQQDTFWNDMGTTIAALIGGTLNGRGGNASNPIVQVTADTGMIVVRAYPKDMKLVEQYMIRTQSILGREVIIEAEILDVTLSAAYATGIDWSVLTAGGATDKGSGLPTPTTGLLSNVYTLGLSGDKNNFAYALKLLSSQGKISVLSKPRVSAINNQSAIIKVGTDDYYVTNVQSQVTTGSGGDSSSNSTTSTINLQAFFSGISLYVTPQIGEHGEVTLHIHPSVSQVSQQNLTVEVDGQESNLPVAQSTVRETDTVVHAIDGQVIILGGLMQTDVGLSTSGMPLSPDYADTLSEMTTSRQNFGIKNELVILLRPIIVSDRVWNTELDKTSKEYFTKKSAQEFLTNVRED